MSDFGPEAIAVDWLHDIFAKTEGLSHLRARKRGRVVTVESGPKDAVVPHVRFRRDTVHLWLLEIPGRGGKWDATPFRDDLEALLDLVRMKFPWTLAKL